MLTLTIPFPEDVPDATVQIARLTEDQFAYFIGLLNAMKPGIIRKKERSESAPEQEEDVE